MMDKDNDAKDERIKFLEEELVATRMQLALVKRSEDSLKEQLSNMSKELESATATGNTNVCSAEPSIIPLKSSQNTAPSPFLHTKKNSIRPSSVHLRQHQRRRRYSNQTRALLLLTWWHMHRSVRQLMLGYLQVDYKLILHAYYHLLLRLEAIPIQVVINKKKPIRTQIGKGLSEKTVENMLLRGLEYASPKTKAFMYQRWRCVAIMYRKN